MTMHTLGFIYAIGAAITWGLAYTIDQKILANTPVTVFLFYAFIIGVIFLLPVVFTYERDALISVATTDLTRAFLILFSVALATLANFLILASISHLGAPLASVFEISYPFFVFLFSFFLFGAQFNLSVIAGALLIFAGSVVIIRFG